MIMNFFKNKVDKKIDSKKNDSDDIDIINVIALLLEVSLIDGNIEALEESKIFEVISKYFSLDQKTFNEYYKNAMIMQEDSSSFHNFTSKIHKK